MFDTLKISGGPRSPKQLDHEALARQVNLRLYDDEATGISAG
ncbi:MAG: hypothetical protein U0401_25195 [Anaerolineae bacterium]